MTASNGWERLVDGVGLQPPIAAMPSFCTANVDVLRAIFERFGDGGQPLLIEATCNQVNQHGGYTGMTASAFAGQIDALARECGVDRRRLILGGDHLGPAPWQQRDADHAMREAAAMVASYAAAGFRKIHLDASMRCSGEAALDEALMAERAATLCAASESAVTGERPVYVVGTEVPRPGGTGAEDEALAVTRPPDIRQTLDTHRTAFYRRGLEDAWRRVVAVVVQPGVEFGNETVVQLDADKAVPLTGVLADYPGLGYEAHSTDYQTGEALTGLVALGFRFLKVGPALTFAFREVVFAMAHIESQLFGHDARSHVVSVIEAEMRRDPSHWRSYYRDDGSLCYDMRFSLSDRIRYYWDRPNVKAALATLFDNIEAARDRPALLHQYFPEFEIGAAHGPDEPLARRLIRSRVGRVAGDYMRACALAE